MGNEQVITQWVNQKDSLWDIWEDIDDDLLSNDDEEERADMGVIGSEGDDDQLLNKTLCKAAEGHTPKIKHPNSNSNYITNALSIPKKAHKKLLSIYMMKSRTVSIDDSINSLDRTTLNK